MCIIKFLTVLSLIGLSGSAFAQESRLYLTLKNPVPTNSGSRTEVIEFFSYDGPFCARLNPRLTDWVKKQGTRIAFKRVPVALHPAAVSRQKLFFTLQALGKLDPFHSDIYQSIHLDKVRLDGDPAIVQYVVNKGLDRQKFLDTYNSFAVQQMTRQAAQVRQAYAVDGVPMIAIHGLYVTSLSLVATGMPGASESELQGRLLKVIDQLVAKVSK